MKFSFRPYICPVRYTFPMLLMSLLLPGRVRADCTEYRIVEYEDRVEAVCVGEPLTEAQKKANLEEERRQEMEAQRQKVEEQRRQREAERAGKAQADAEAERERKKKSAQPATPQPPLNRPTTTNPQILYK